MGPSDRLAPLLLGMLSLRVGESEREFKALGRKPLTLTLAPAGPAKARGADFNYFYLLRSNLRKEGFLPQGREGKASLRHQVGQACSVKPFWKHLHRHAHRCISMVILNPSS